MTPKRHSIFDELDPFDPLEGAAFDVENPLDELDEVCYSRVPDETTVCDFGFGDEDGFCIKAQFGCHIEGCSFADRNE